MFYRMATRLVTQTSLLLRQSWNFIDIEIEQNVYSFFAIHFIAELVL